MLQPVFPKEVRGTWPWRLLFHLLLEWLKAFRLQESDVVCPLGFLSGRFPSPKFPSVLQGWELRGSAAAAPRQGLSSPPS